MARPGLPFWGHLARPSIPLLVQPVPVYPFGVTWPVPVYPFWVSPSQFALFGSHGSSQLNWGGPRDPKRAIWDALNQNAVNGVFRGVGEVGGVWGVGGGRGVGDFGGLQGTSGDFREFWGIFGDLGDAGDLG